ncbi:hypothetical protein [Planctobacterium marinum]|uniref:hypothetical protein n=1 Tax=Planctobacterium marinum TaxID=1631968 RepID=UPI001E4C7F41|nr:hypothetical protein [Planctobacterium marinum]MCC2606917.1 hypothetical protein [Planctobacterium marinum]
MCPEKSVGFCIALQSPNLRFGPVTDQEPEKGQLHRVKLAKTQHVMEQHNAVNNSKLALTLQHISAVIHVRDKDETTLIFR